MSRSLLFRKLLAHAEENKIKDPETGEMVPYLEVNQDEKEVSFGKIMHTMRLQDSVPVLSRYHPSETQYETLKEKYGSPDQVTIDESDPEYLRHITPYAKVTSEGAFFVLHVKKPFKGDPKNPEYKDISMLCFHPSAELVSRAIVGDKDDEGNVITLDYIQSRPDKFRPIQLIEPFESKPHEIEHLDETIRDAENDIFKTDNDRLIAEMPNGEWRNKRVMYYYEKDGKDKVTGEPLYTIKQITTRGRVNSNFIDGKNKTWLKGGETSLGKVLLLKPSFSALFIPKRTVAKCVKKDEITKAVESDFSNHTIDAIISGADPYLEFNRVSGKKMGFFRSIWFKIQRSAEDFILQAAQDNNDLVKGMLRSAFLKGAAKLVRPVLGLLFTFARTLMAFARIPGALPLAAGAGSWGHVPVWQTAVLVVGFAFLGLFSSMLSNSQGFKRSKKHQLYEDVVAEGEIHKNMQADQGRFPVCVNILSKARFARDAELIFDDLKEGVRGKAVTIPDETYDHLWREHHQLEDYSPTSLPKASVTRLLRVGRYDAMFTEAPSGDFRIFIPEKNLTIQWRDPENKVSNAGPVSRYRERKFANGNADYIFLMRHLGKADHLPLDEIMEENKVHKDNWDEVANLLEQIAIESMEAQSEPQPYLDQTAPRLETPDHVRRTKIFGVVPFIGWDWKKPEDKKHVNDDEAPDSGNAGQKIDVVLEMSGLD